MSFADRFRKARVAAGLSQKDAAAGITASSYISLIESGARIPKHELIQAFAERFGVSVDSLVNDLPDITQQLALTTIRAQINSGDFGEAVADLEKIIATGSAESSVVLQARLLMAKCQIGLNDYSQAIDNLEALVRNEQPENSSLQAEAVLDLLRCHLRSGDIAHGAQVGELYISGDRKDIWPPAIFVSILCQTATCHVALGNLNRAQKLAQEAGEIAQSIADPRALAFYEWERSGIAESLGNSAEAMTLMKRALSHAHAAELLDSLPRMKAALAILTVNAGTSDMVSAKALGETALLECLASGNTLSAAYACLALAELAWRNSDAELALKHALEGLNLIPNQQAEPYLELEILKIKAQYRLDDDIEKLASTADLLTAVDRYSVEDLSHLWVFIAREYAAMESLMQSNMAFEKALSVKNTHDSPAKPTTVSP